MSETRYGHDKVSSGTQDQGERKDDGWTSRQGGDESRQPGRRGETEPTTRESRSLPPPGTNTQGHLPGIGEASDQTRAELDRIWRRGFPSDDDDDRTTTAGTRDENAGAREQPAGSDDPAAGTDQPPRMGGPLGPDPENPHLPKGEQNGQTRGTGARGFDVGVDASTVGAVHQGVREEDVRNAR